MSTATGTRVPAPVLLPDVGSAEEQAGIDQFLALVAAGNRAIVAWDLAHPDTRAPRASGGPLSRADALARPAVVEDASEPPAGAFGVGPTP